MNKILDVNVAIYTYIERFIYTYIAISHKCKIIKREFRSIDINKVSCKVVKAFLELLSDMLTTDRQTTVYRNTPCR